MSLAAAGRTVRLEDVSDRLLLADVTGASDPRAVYEDLRTRWGAVAPVDLEPGVPAWLALGFDEVSTVLRDEVLFTRDVSAWRYERERLVAWRSPTRAVVAHRDSLHDHDGDEHRRLRFPVSEALAGFDDKRLGRTVTVAATTVLDRLASRGEGDLVADYAVPVVVRVLADMLGMTLADAQRMHELAAVVRSGDDGAYGAASEQENLLAGFVASRRAEPGDDLTSMLLAHPAHASDLEVMGAVGMLFRTAQAALVAWTAVFMSRMLTDPDLAGRLHGGRLVLSDALDLVARDDPPLPHLLPRYARTATELGGQAVAAGDAVVPALTAANRAVQQDDPWDDVGSRFHLTWGAGAHGCPAHRAAPMVTRLLCGQFLAHVTDMDLAVPAAQVPVVRSPWVRYPRALPVRFRRV